MNRTANINMTGHWILIPGLELAAEFETCERGALDAPDMIPAGYSRSARHIESVVCLPCPHSVERGA